MIPRDHRAGRSAIRPGLQSIRADHLAARAGAQGPPGLEVDAVLDELDGAVGEADVDASRVITRGRDDTLAPAEAIECGGAGVAGVHVGGTKVEIAVPDGGPGVTDGPYLAAAIR